MPCAAWSDLPASCGGPSFLVLVSSLCVLDACPLGALRVRVGVRRLRFRSSDHRYSTAAITTTSTIAAAVAVIAAAATATTAGHIISATLSVSAAAAVAYRAAAAAAAPHHHPPPLSTHSCRHCWAARVHPRTAMAHSRRSAVASLRAPLYADAPATH